jgi:hypothetical protein
MFMLIDNLSREGAITLRPYARFQYLVSLASTPQQALHFNAAGALPVNCNS